MKVQIKTFILLIVSLTGCATSGYKEFYQPISQPDLERILKKRAGAPSVNPIVDRTPPMEDLSPVFEQYFKRGYSYIGMSSFQTGQRESDESAIKQAKEVGADLVLIINPTYAGSKSTVIPITTPTTSTSFSSGNVTAYGPGGAVNVFGNGTTTTFGSVTNMVPITIHRTNYGAAYFIKSKIKFGLMLRDLDDVERKKIDTNKGSVIRIVVDDSPAFTGDLLAGDIIIAIDNEKVESTQSVLKIFETKNSSDVEFSVLRDGRRIKKIVRVP